MLGKLMQWNCDPDYDAEGQGGTATAGPGYDDSPAGGSDSGEEIDRDALEQSTKQRLAEAFGDEADTEDGSGEQDDEQKPDEPDDSEDGEEEPEESEDSSESEGSEEGDGSDDEEAAAEDEQESDAPTLPDAYRRSLKAYGWEDDEIDQNVKALGDSFIKTAERIHQNRNKELQDWAAAGRKAREQQDEGQQGSDGQEQQAGQQQKGDGSQPSLEKLDPEKLREKYGEDEEIEQVVQTVNKTVDTLNQILPQVQQAHQTAQQSEIEAVEREVKGFFGRDDIAAYSDLYGDENQGLTDEQIEVRNKVLDNAYNLKLGARQLHGQELSLHDALERAHEMVSGEHKATAARKQVKKQAKKRNRSISQKPSGKKGSGTKTPDGRPQSREELEERTKSRLQNAFGG